MNKGEHHKNLMTRIEAADFLRVSPQTLARWAVNRSGPKYYRYGGRAIYKIVDLVAFANASAIEPFASH